MWKFWRKIVQKSKETQMTFENDSTRNATTRFTFGFYPSIEQLPWDRASDVRGPEKEKEPIETIISSIWFIFPRKNYRPISHVTVKPIIPIIEIKRSEFSFNQYIFFSRIILYVLRHNTIAILFKKCVYFNYVHI